MKWPDPRSTEMILGIAEEYGKADHWTLCFEEADLSVPSSQIGRIAMMEEKGLLKFTHSPYKSEERELRKIDSLALTPDGEEYLESLRRKSPLGKLRVASTSIFVAIVTSVLTIVAMKLFGLVD